VLQFHTRATAQAIDVLLPAESPCLPLAAGLPGVDVDIHNDVTSLTNPILNLLQRSSQQFVVRGSACQPAHCHARPMDHGACPTHRLAEMRNSSHTHYQFCTSAGSVCQLASASAYQARFCRTPPVVPSGSAACRRMSSSTENAQPPLETPVPPERAAEACSNSELEGEVWRTSGSQSSQNSATTRSSDASDTFSMSFSVPSPPADHPVPGRPQHGRPSTSSPPELGHADDSDPFLHPDRGDTSIDRVRDAIRTFGGLESVPVDGPTEAPRPDFIQSLATLEQSVEDPGAEDAAWEDFVSLVRSRKDARAF
jgi:hypothetical protein